MPYITGPACSLFVETIGEGVPVTVFAHGVSSSTEELRPLAAATPGTRVLYDLRGHGASGTPPESAGYDHPAMRADLEVVASTFGATQAFGTSVGAGAILNLLAREPARFERVVLFLPASVDEPNTADHAASLELAGLLEKHPLEEVARRAIAASAGLLAVRPYWRELIHARTLRMNAKGLPRALRLHNAGHPPVDNAESLRAVSAPVLILAHEGDPIHDVAHARRLAGIMPNALLKIWPEPLAMYDDVEAFARLIGEFLAG